MASAVGNVKFICGWSKFIEPTSFKEVKLISLEFVFPGAQHKCFVEMPGAKRLPPTYWIKQINPSDSKQTATLSTTVEKAAQAYVRALVVKQGSINTTVELHFQYSTLFQPGHVYQLDCSWTTQSVVAGDFQLECSVIDVTWCLPVDILDILRPPIASELQQVYTTLLRKLILTATPEVKTRLEAMLHCVGCLTSDRYMLDVVVSDIIQETYNKQPLAFREKCQRIFNSAPGNLKTPDEKQQLTAVLKKHLALHSNAVVRKMLDVCLQNILTSTAASTDTPEIIDTISRQLKEAIACAVHRQQLGKKYSQLFTMLTSSTSV